MFGGIWTTNIKGSKQAYVVFRGSQTNREWARDEEADQVAWPSSPSMVHRGFLAIYQQVKPKLFKAIKELAPTSIYISGHSLGAAVATMAAYDVHTNSPDHAIMQTYVFASPRVGNLEFATLVDAALPEFYRVVNLADFVNAIPLPVQPNFTGDHVPCIYQHVGQRVTFDRNWGSWENNHLLANYANCLEDPAAPSKF